jgi:hypothetical protein
MGCYLSVDVVLLVVLVMAVLVFDVAGADRQAARCSESIFGFAIDTLGIFFGRA